MVLASECKSHDLDQRSKSLTEKTSPKQCKIPPCFQSEKTMIDLLNTGPRDGVTLLLAHGAGAGMDSAFMEQVAGDLAELGIGVARFEFPYTQIVRQTGRRRPPDPQSWCGRNLRFQPWRTAIGLCATCDQAFALDTRGSWPGLPTAF